MPTLQKKKKKKTECNWSTKEKFQSQVSEGACHGKNDNFNCLDINYKKKYPKPRWKI